MYLHSLILRIIIFLSVLILINYLSKIKDLGILLYTYSLFSVHNEYPNGKYKMYSILINFTYRLV